MSFCFERRQKQVSTGTTNKAQAEKFYAKVKTMIAEGKWLEVDESKTRMFDELIEKFMKEHAPQQSPSTRQRYVSCLNSLKPFFEGLLLKDITPRLLTEYQQKRLMDGVKPATVNRERSMISKAFNLAWKQWEWVKENPCHKVPKLQENNTVERYLSPEEEDRLISAAEELYVDAGLPDIIRIALNTGMRQGEI